MGKYQTVNFKMWILSDTVEAEITADVWAVVQAKKRGHPDMWEPGEGGQVDITEIAINGVAIDDCDGFAGLIHGCYTDEIDRLAHDAAALQRADREDERLP